jgi:phage terminase large subunit-like protein
MEADDLRRLIATETAGWDAASIQSLNEAIESMDAPGGWRPFYCEKVDCNGQPHGNWTWAHARWDQHPPSDWGDAYIYCVLSGRGAGKALDVTTPIPTPTGWTTMGDLRDGDMVLGSDGAPTRVLRAWDPYVAPAFSVRFSDGASLVADAEHQWSMTSRADRRAGRARRTVTTAQIAARLTVASERNWSAPVAAPLDLPHADLPIDPWVLGFWLGDGSSAAGEVTVSDTDYPEVAALAAARGEPLGSVGRRKPDARCATYSFGTRPEASDPATGRRVANGSLHSRLRALGLLRNKHVPLHYLRASAAQRFDLLAGLIDSDGHVTDRGYVEICVTREILAEGIAALARTLGHRVTMVKSPAVLNGVPVGLRWRISFTTRSGGGLLPRKSIDRPGLGQPNRLGTRMVDAVVPVGERVLRCITVDSPDSCYLAGEDLLVTHNTRMGAEWVHRLARNYPGCYIGMIAPTVDAARDTLVEGESGILRTGNPAFKPVWEPSKRKVTWPNGSTAQTFSADLPERLRGPQHGFLWFDEAGSFKNFEDTWSNALFGLRLGDAPKVLITTTPRPRQWLRDMVVDPQVIVQRVSTYANINNLADSYKATVIKRYEGTALGQQELEGQILDDDFGEALWMDSDIREADMPIPAEDLHWHVIGVDPAVTSGGDETGIVVCAATAEKDPARRQAVVLGDYTVTGAGPDVWVQKVINIYRSTPQPCIVLVESNQGGELIGGMIHQIDKTIPISYVHAHKSKEVRADPIVLAYRMGRVQHKTGLTDLRFQMTTWIPGFSKESPGRIDALVHALTGLLIDSRLLRSYGKVKTAGSVTDVRTFTAKRSVALREIQTRRAEDPGQWRGVGLG